MFIEEGAKNGTLNRWKGHVNDSKRKNGGNCRLLNEEIRLYELNKFKVVPILTCLIEELNYYSSIKIFKFFYVNILNAN